MSFRLKFSILCEHKFRHNFDSLNPICNYGARKESNDHSLQHCPQFDLMHAAFFGQLSEISALDINDTDAAALGCN